MESRFWEEVQRIEDGNRIRHVSTQTDESQEEPVDRSETSTEDSDEESECSEAPTEENHESDDESPYAIPDDSQEFVFPPLPVDRPEYRVYYNNGRILYNTMVGDHYDLGSLGYTAEDLLDRNPYEFESLSHAIDGIEHGLNANGYQFLTGAPLAYEIPETEDSLSQANDPVVLYTTDEELEDEWEEARRRFCYAFNEDEYDTASNYSTESTTSCYYF